MSPKHGTHPLAKFLQMPTQLHLRRHLSPSRPNAQHEGETARGRYCSQIIESPWVQQPAAWGAPAFLFLSFSTLVAFLASARSCTHGRPFSSRLRRVCHTLQGCCISARREQEHRIYSPNLLAEIVVIREIFVEDVVPSIFHLSSVYPMHTLSRRHLPQQPFSLGHTSTCSRVYPGYTGSQLRLVRCACQRVS